jgi:peptidoglycan/xylan/chitin deacetylase (PgdA/CDA1 family)
MTDERLIQIGNAFRLSGCGVLARSTVSSDNIRIPITHFVHEERMEDFELIIRYLKSRRQFITPAQFFRHYRQNDPEPIRGKLLLMTFDDGLLSSYHAAQRVLDPLGVRALFFVPTMIFELKTDAEMRQFAWDNLYHKRRPIESLRPEEYKVMTIDQARELQRGGHMILPHTYSHLNLSEIATQDVADRELRDPRRMLEDALQFSADGFAFPVGTERVINEFAYGEVRKNYTFCFPALPGFNTQHTDPYFFYRDCVHPHYPLSHVRNVIDGVYDPYYRLKMRRLRERAGSTAS